MSHVIKQLEERHVSVEIKLLKWNDRMDLLAIANIKGEVSLHRLTWQRVWCLRPENDESQVIDMSWRPDGKILAIAYSTGNIILVEVENKNILHTIETENEVSSIDWHQEKQNVEKPNGDMSNLKKELSNVDSNIYLMDLPSVTNKYPQNSATENYIDYTFLKNQNELNILLIGTKCGKVHISIFGIFICATINISKNYLKKNCSIIKSQISDDFKKLFATTVDLENKTQIVIVDSEILNLHSKELFLMALKLIFLISLLKHLEQTMLSITEAWESILLEMDSKLSKYASNVPEGAVCADFLDLLMCGIPSEEMEEFLMQDLTDKGLKKLGHSIELSYSNIQKLLLMHMNTVGQNITFHLTELRGMARLAHRYKNLGLVENYITDAILANGSFLVKIIEVQQVINMSMSNYTAFFRWLYVVILRLSDEQIPPETPKMTQQDLLYITEFLKNFDSIDGENKIEQNDENSKNITIKNQKNKFHLETLGQYLLNEPLKILPNKDNNVWSSFLEENECFRENKLVINQQSSLSLVQSQKFLVEKIFKIFSEPKNLISNNFNCIKTLNLGTLDQIVTSQINLNNSTTLFAFLNEKPPSTTLTLLSISTEKITQLQIFSTNFNDSDSILKFLDCKFYTPSHLSVILQDDSNVTSYICQIPLLSKITQSMVEINAFESSFLLSGAQGFSLSGSASQLNICEVPNVIFKKIEGMTALNFAVSGSRHVSVVLSENRHKVQLFEMEADDDDEEEEGDSTINITQE